MKSRHERHKLLTLKLRIGDNLSDLEDILYFPSFPNVVLKNECIKSNMIYLKNLNCLRFLTMVNSATIGIFNFIDLLKFQKEL